MLIIVVNVNIFIGNVTTVVAYFVIMTVISNVNIRVTYIFSISVNVIAIYRVIIIANTMRIIVRVVIKNFTVMYINKELNDFVFHHVLFPEICNLFFIKHTVHKVAFTNLI